MKITMDKQKKALTYAKDTQYFAFRSSDETSIRGWCTYSESSKVFGIIYFSVEKGLLAWGERGEVYIRRMHNLSIDAIYMRLPFDRYQDSGSISTSLILHSRELWGSITALEEGAIHGMGFEKARIQGFGPVDLREFSTDKWEANYMLFDEGKANGNFGWLEYGKESSFLVMFSTESNYMMALNIEGLGEVPNNGKGYTYRWRRGHVEKVPAAWTVSIKGGEDVGYISLEDSVQKHEYKMLRS